MERIELETYVATLPQQPGVYRFKDAAGEILYIGKAVNLRGRVRSYFSDRPDRAKIRRMMPQVRDVEVTIVGSELEALVLECNLIKQHRPKYNTRLKDDKHYPYIKVSLDEEWPRVFVTRRFAKDGARYFGPFTDSRSVWKILDLLNKLFRFRRCNFEITGKGRPCLDFHINRCLGVCAGKATHADYMAAIKQVCLFLDGRQDEIVRQMRKRMEVAAESLEFERAAYLRDQLQAIESVVQRQKVISTAAQDEDVIAIARNEDEACAEVFLIRGGKLIGSEHFMLANSDDEDPAALMSSFITQFYDAAPFVPPTILVPEALGESQVIEEWLRSKRGAKVQLKVPRRGEKRELMEMAAANAATALDQMRAKWMADRKKTSAALQELADYLDLPEPPSRMECYDISNIQGTSQVASMVVFEDGQPAKNAYRRFQIKAVEGANDFASMQEVLRRRFKRAKTDAERWPLPNLVIVDGGKGQLNAAREVFAELSVSPDVSLVSLAKENEEIFVPNQSTSIWLPRDSQSLYLVQRIRDEAHRFAITYHRGVRSKRAFKSPLDEIAGIGPKRKAALIKQFGSVKALRDATLDEIAAVPGMTRASAAAIKEKL